eukprot:Nitzschia sp. Nitz4//scaffold23_size168460//142616//145687//NITZ4_002245-RA/size168460-snap-gene-0.168-mRNA-1//-1//CDS//3329543713//3230//frame0
MTEARPRPRRSQAVLSSLQEQQRQLRQRRGFSISGPSQAPPTDGGDVLDVHSTAMRRAAREITRGTLRRSRRSLVPVRMEPSLESLMALESSDDWMDEDDDAVAAAQPPALVSSVSAPVTRTNISLLPTSAPSNYGSLEQDPLIPKANLPKPSTPPASWKSIVIQQLTSVIVVGLLNIMMGIPFGASYFPIGWRASDGGEDAAPDDLDQMQGAFPVPGKQALGFRMFLFATTMGQLVFTFASKLDSAVGLQMVENVPFYHALAFIALKNQGYGKDTLSTLFFLFGLSSVMVGVTFYLLGKWKMGRLVYYFPNHVLVGCIGGIGVFITITSMEVTIDQTISWTPEGIVTVFEQWSLWSVVLGFEIVLRCLQYATQDANGSPKYPMLSPVYYCMITPVFYLGLMLIGVSKEQAGTLGYFFPSIPTETSPFADPHLFDIFTLIDMSQVSWSTVMQCTGTLCALTCFSWIHVPIMIPAYAISMDVDADMNAELLAHGFANGLSGLFGGIQAYMTYSNSVLYAKSGGRGKFSSLGIVALNALLFVVGPAIASYLPRCVAGTLLLHIGIDLTLEGLYDSIGDFDTIEYLGIWAITIVMTVWGMTAALIAGVIAALTTYAAQSINYQSPIRHVISASTLRSSAWNRPKEADEILDDDLTGRARILIFQLQGHLFFGNVAQLTDTLKIALKEKKELEESPIVVILDFTLVVGIDSSAAHAIAKLKKVIHRLFHIEVSIFVTGDEGGFPCEFDLSTALAEQSGTTIGSRTSCRVCVSLDKALEVAENLLITRQNPRLETQSKLIQSKDSYSKVDEQRMGKEALKYLLPPSERLEGTINTLWGMMEREIYTKDALLWEAGDGSDSLKLLVVGTLTSLIDETGASETVEAGSVVGELGLVQGTRRLTSVVAGSEDTIVYSLSRAKFDQLKRSNPVVVAAIDAIVIRYLAHRVQHVNNRYFNEHLPV